MKKILTIFATIALTLPVLGEFQVSSLHFYFFDPDSENGKSLSATPVRYEDGTKLVKNESFRALAVWWDGFDSVEDDYIPFELNVQGEPVFLPEVENAAAVWMETTTFGETGAHPKYVAVGDIPGIAGVTSSSLPTGAYTFSFSLNENVVEANLPDSYKKTSYHVYLITQDTRNADGTVAEGAPTSLVKWNAIYATTCEYDAYYIGKPFALNFKAPEESFNLINVPSKASPTLDPYVEKPEITFPGEPSDDVKAAAIEALIAALGEDAAATVTYVTNPEVAAEINGIITGPGTVDLENGVATFTYEFKVSEISFGESGVTVKVELGENERGETQSFAKDVAVTLVELNGDPVDGTVGEIAENRETATVTVGITSDTLLFKAKAEKADSTNEESADED